jgi:hypothetical protein
VAKASGCRELEAEQISRNLTDSGISRASMLAEQIVNTRIFKGVVYAAIILGGIMSGGNI